MNIIPFESAKVPAALTAMFADSNKNLIGNSAGEGFPVISIKGKVFHITRGGERTLVTKPGEDDPAASIEVVIVGANPNNSKVYYKGTYVEGSKDAPPCFSNDGITPDPQSAEPQSTKCAICPHNQWGSRITDNGTKGKSCADSRRIAVATPDTPEDPMLVRVPAASLKGLVEFGKILAARGVPPEAVITKIGFDHTQAYPSLTFKPIGLIGDPVQWEAIKEVATGALVKRILGLTPGEAPAESPAVAAATPAPAPAPAPTAAPTPAPTAAPKAVKKAPAKSIEETLAAAAPAAESAPAAAPAAPAAAPAATVVSTTTANLESQIASMVDGMDFDD